MDNAKGSKMKTYQEAVFQIALKHAHAIRGGGHRSEYVGERMVAWIYGVTLEELEEAVVDQHVFAWQESAK